MPPLDSIMDAIGNTPLVRLNRMAKDTKATVMVKLEGENPGKSVKDRLGMQLIKDAEEEGKIAPGKTTLVEATSGNTGIALAMLGASRGYDVVLTMPDTMSLERRVVLRAFGAQCILTSAKAGLVGAVRQAVKIVEDINSKTKETGKNAFLTRQFESLSNAKVHRETTGPEVYRDTDGKLDVFVAGVGTGGTITGVAQFLKSKGCKAKIIAVEPEESQAMGKKRAGEPFTPAPHKIQGIGAGLVPEVLDLDLVDEIIPITSDEAIATSLRLPKEEGLLSGISAGAIVAAALKVARRPEHEGHNIVAVIPSAGERYLSTDLFASLMNECRELPVIPKEDLDKLQNWNPPK